MDTQRGQHTVDVRAVHGTLRGEDQPQPPLTGAHETAGGDQHTDTAGIAEPHLGEVEYERSPAVRHRVVHMLAHRRRRDQVHLPGHLEYGPWALFVLCHLQRHALEAFRSLSDRMGPAASGTRPSPPRLPGPSPLKLFRPLGATGSPPKAMPQRPHLFADIRSHTDNASPYAGTNDRHRSASIGQYRHKARPSLARSLPSPSPSGLGLPQRSVRCQTRALHSMARWFL